MRLVIRQLNIPQSASLSRHVHKKFGGALDRVGHTVRRVVVRLFDVNGPRGGQDKRCHVLVELQGGEAVFLDETTDCLYASIDRASTRAGHLVRERLRRTKEKRPARRISA